VIKQEFGQWAEASMRTVDKGNRLARQTLTDHFCNCKDGGGGMDGLAHIGELMATIAAEMGKPQRPEIEPVQVRIERLANTMQFSSEEVTDWKLHMYDGQVMMLASWYCDKRKVDPRLLEFDEGDSVEQLLHKLATVVSKRTQATRATLFGGLFGRPPTGACLAHGWPSLPGQ